ncbi:MAG: Smr/MutS family protein [Candidatus Eremiobacteraeota bacterium]|nr:Smr/MutS family protein [Candidatus Eremiobacteraeota bacterium]
MSLADARTLEALDFASVRERVVEATRTHRGRARAASLAPESTFDAVADAQRRTAAMRTLQRENDFYIMPAVDTQPLTEAAAVGQTLGAPELRSIGDALSAAAAAYRAVQERSDLAGVAAAYRPLRELAGALVRAIDESGNVLDRASPALGRIRRAIAHANAEARDRISKILGSAKNAKAIQEHIVTIRNGRFVIPIKSEFAGAVPGIVHDTSSSGQTLFVEPLGALESNNRVRTLQLEEEREVNRILDGLSRDVGREAAQIEINVEMLAVLDLLYAKAEVAKSGDAIAPELTEEAEVTIHHGRHPLLGERAVAQSLRVDGDVRLLLISGPNMGGKTVALKMAGLFVVMAYCGMQLPAAVGTRIGKFGRVIADIGDEQSLVANTSTFSAHLARLREVLDGAGPSTLALLDEIGAGTEPNTGAALARALLEGLLRRGARAIVSTHSLELKLFAHSTPGVANASVRFDPATFAPTFELDVGTPGQSLALPLASRLGIEAQIIARAEELLEGRQREYEAALVDLSARSSKLRDTQASLGRERAEVAQQLESLARERRQLEEERRKFAARAEERFAARLREFVQELTRAQSQGEAQRRRAARVTPAQTRALSTTIEAIHRDLGIAQRDASADGAMVYKPGDRVLVSSMNQSATVAEDWDDRLLVSIGSMKMLVAKADVRRESASTGGSTEPRSEGAAVRLAAAARGNPSLDVRGMRYAQAEPIVEKWIDDALLAGTTPLRLIHGKGTGMLGRGLQEYLHAHPGVTAVRYANEEEGSTGVTIIDLRA